MTMEWLTRGAGKGPTKATTLIGIRATCGCGAVLNGQVRVGKPLRCECGASSVAVSGMKITHHGLAPWASVSVWYD